MSTNKTLFPRAQIKYKAREALTGNWPAAIGITLITLFFSLGGSYGCIKLIFPEMTFIEFFSPFAATSEPNFDVFLNPTMWIFFAFATMFYSLFIEGVINFAVTMWYVKLVKEDKPIGIGYFFESFSFGLKGIGLYLWKSIWLAIWNFVFGLPIMLLLGTLAVIGLTTFEENVVLAMILVPLLLLFAMFCLAGIIYKYIQYSMSFFALADNPKLGIRKALKTSIKVTKGRIFDLIVFALSFILWSILTGILPPVSFYVVPYMSASYAKVWLFLRDEAIEENQIKPEDFNCTKIDDLLAEVVSVQADVVHNSEDKNV